MTPHLSGSRDPCNSDQDELHVVHGQHVDEVHEIARESAAQKVCCYSAGRGDRLCGRGLLLELRPEPRADANLRRHVALRSSATESGQSQRLGDLSVFHAPPVRYGCRNASQIAVGQPFYVPRRRTTAIDRHVRRKCYFPVVRRTAVSRRCGSVRPADAASGRSMCSAIEPVASARTTIHRVCATTSIIRPV